MSEQPVFARSAALARATAHVAEFYRDPVFVRRRAEAGDAACDFLLGNPQEMPLPGYVAALQRAVVPENPNWFAYGGNQPAARAAVVESLRARLGLTLAPEDVFITPGGAGALAIGIKAVTAPGDEVIFSLPPWFFYEMFAVEAGLTPVKVSIDHRTFDLDLDAIAAAITPRTRLVIVNTPHNPTGKVYPPETLRRLGALLEDASRRNGRTIYLLSDEVYNRIVFSGAEFHSPLEFYAESLLAYSYGKTLLTPGDRLGYLALSPRAAELGALRQSVFLVQTAGGFDDASRTLQHALPDLERLSIDIAAVERRRDRLVGALRDLGYEVHSPEGAFYLLPRSPLDDDQAFWYLLMEHNIFALPGTFFEFPGFFRLSLTANDDMIERSLPGFAAAMAHARQAVG